jgi:hypothetical protein
METRAVTFLILFQCYQIERKLCVRSFDCSIAKVQRR